MAPDGVERLMLVYNNSYPGPLITANWGDWVVVHVTNNLQNNGFFTLWGIANLSTSIHWHGIIQENNCANDGVPGVTQCNYLKERYLILRPNSSRILIHLQIPRNQIRNDLVPQPLLTPIFRRSSRPLSDKWPQQCELGC